ncbi:MAG: response regulator [Chloroflexi bacterium]|nr:response regulator [Chloroflexota bacterium]
MTTVLVADDDRDLRNLLSDILLDAGYEVTEAKDGREAFEKACSERPDVILLDVQMPFMDGFEVLRRLRENPDTRETPVVMLTVVPTGQGALPALELGVTHYLIKPIAFDLVEVAVKVALREAGSETGEAEPDSESDSESDSMPRVSTVIRTGSQQLNQLLGGGIPLGSLTLMEGTPTTGKTVLCQHITHESLIDGHGVAYFSSEDTADRLLARMRSIGLKVSTYLHSETLRISRTQDPSLAEGPDCDYTPDQLLAMLAQELEGLPDKYRTIIIDGVTNLATLSQDTAILRFFSTCKRLSDDGKAIIVVAQPHAFDERMLVRLSDLCDAHLRLRVEKIGAKSATTLEVLKANSVQLKAGSVIAFEVLPGVGIQNMPFGKVKV